MTRDIRLDEMGNAERLTRNAGWQPVERQCTGFDAENYRELQADTRQARIKRELQTALRHIEIAERDRRQGKDHSADMYVVEKALGRAQSALTSPEHF